MRLEFVTSLHPSACSPVVYVLYSVLLVTTQFSYCNGYSNDVAAAVAHDIETVVRHHNIKSIQASCLQLRSGRVYLHLRIVMLYSPYHDRYILAPMPPAR